MKTERKIEILENAKAIIKSFSKNRRGKGLCFAIAEGLTRLESEKQCPYFSMEFLGIEEPKPIKDSLYWFELNKEGDNKRIKIINKAIKKLKTKKVK
jgi:hypothetical protein